MDDYHRLLVITDETPIGSDLRGNRFRFDVIDNITDVSLKRLRFEIFLTERAEGIHTEYNLTPVLTEHERERIELTVKRTHRINGAVACFWLKKGTDIEIFMRFELNLRAFPICLRTKQFWVGTPCYGFLSLCLGEDGRERTVCLYKPTTDIAREADLGRDDLVEIRIQYLMSMHLFLMDLRRNGSGHQFL